MKKLISNITAIAMGAFAFIGLLFTALNVFGKITDALYGSATGYQFISFSQNYVTGADVTTIEIFYSIFAIIMFVVAACLIAVSLLRMFADKKKSKLNMIQNALACVLALVSILVLVFAIVYVQQFNLIGFYAKIGMATILTCAVSVVGAVLVLLFNKK